MKKFKKLILTLIVISLILSACFRIDKGEQKPEKISIFNDAKIAQKSVYKPLQTINYNGIDYRLSRSEIGKFGGQIITSTIGEGPKTFNPWVSKDATSSLIGDLMYDSLFSTDPDTGEVIPHLAKEMIVSDNQTTYTIRLRKGIKWSDGKEITADDVIFTWEDIILAGLGNTSLRDSVLIDGEYPKVRKIDNYTIEFKIKKPFAPFQRFVGTQIAPKHIFEQATKKRLKIF